MACEGTKGEGKGKGERLSHTVEFDQGLTGPC